MRGEERGTERREARGSGASRKGRLWNAASKLIILMCHSNHKEGFDDNNTLISERNPFWTNEQCVLQSPLPDTTESSSCELSCDAKGESLTRLGPLSINILSTLYS